MRGCVLVLLFLSLTSCATLMGDRSEEALLHMKIGTSHFENGNYPLALKELLEAEKLDGKNPLIQNNLGLTYFMRERFDLAEKHLRKALSLKKDYTDARNNLARVLISAGRYKEAEDELKLVFDDLTYNGLEKAWINHGLSRFNQKDWKGARESFAKALRESRDSCVANSYFGRSLFEDGDYRRASEALDRAVGFCQKQMYDEPHYFSALAWYRLGDKDRAVARFEEIQSLYPNGKYRDKSRAMLDLIRKGVE